jgi:hypothetical protein
MLREWRNATDFGATRRAEQEDEKNTTKEEQEKYYVKNEKTVILPFLWCGYCCCEISKYKKMRTQNTKNAQCTPGFLIAAT